MCDAIALHQWPWETDMGPNLHFLPILQPAAIIFDKSKKSDIWLIADNIQILRERWIINAN